MCTYWQNTVYELSVVKGSAEWEVRSFHPDQIYLIWLFSFFLSNRRQNLFAVLIFPPSDIAGTPCHPVFQIIDNPKFYLYLINNNTMMVYGGSVEVHRRTFSSFPSVT